MTELQTQPNILIAGLGNLLLKDDGVGIHAVYEMQKDPPQDVEVVEIGTAVLDALHLIEWADYILAFDAMRAGGKPGTVYAFGIKDVEDRAVQASLHELSLVAALRFLPNKVTPKIVILGVEPEEIDYGMELTPTVQESLPRLIKAARDIVGYWKTAGSEDGSKVEQLFSDILQRA